MHVFRQQSEMERRDPQMDKFIVDRCNLRTIPDELGDDCRLAVCYPLWIQVSTYSRLVCGLVSVPCHLEDSSIRLTITKQTRFRMTLIIEKHKTHICAETEIVIDNALFSQPTSTLTKPLHLIDNIYLSQNARSVNQVRATAGADSAAAPKTVVGRHSAIDLRVVDDTGAKDVSVPSIGFQELHIPLRHCGGYFLFGVSISPAFGTHQTLSLYWVDFDMGIAGALAGGFPAWGSELGFRRICWGRQVQTQMLGIVFGVDSGPMGFEPQYRL